MRDIIEKLELEKKLWNIVDEDKGIEPLLKDQDHEERSN